MASSDRIELRRIRVLGTHGLLPEERQRPQPFEVDIDVGLDLAPGGASDDLADTVDYGHMVDKTRAIVEGPHSYRLLEALAAAIADAVMEDVRVRSVTVSLRKLRPPLPVDCDTVGVRVTRER